jgi:hypothetical protein
LLGGSANVAALCIEDNRDAGVFCVNVGNQRLELVFGAAGGEVGDLRLESADQISGRVDDGGTEFDNLVIAALEMGGKLAGSGSRPTQSRESFFCQAAASCSVKVIQRPSFFRR